MASKPVKNDESNQNNRATGKIVFRSHGTSGGAAAWKVD